jgi:hypothetical protein
MRCALVSHSMCPRRPVHRARIRLAGNTKNVETACPSVYSGKATSTFCIIAQADNLCMHLRPSNEHPLRHRNLPLHEQHYPVHGEFASILMVENTGWQVVVRDANPQKYSSGPMVNGRVSCINSGTQPTVTSVQESDAK